MSAEISLVLTQDLSLIDDGGVEDLQSKVGSLCLLLDRWIYLVEFHRSCKVSSKTNSYFVSLKITKENIN